MYLLTGHIDYVVIFDSLGKWNISQMGQENDMFNQVGSVAVKWDMLIGGHFVGTRLQYSKSLVDKNTCMITSY
jgi:hypothetical protein